MTSLASELKKVIKQETKEISKHVFLDEDANLTLKINAKQLKSAIKIDSNKEPTGELSSAWIGFLDDFRKYNVDDAESLTILLDAKSDKKYVDSFQQTWKRYFGINIAKQNKKTKKVKNKILFSLFWGIVALLITIALSLLAALMPQPKPWIIVQIVAGSVADIIAWVLLWEVFYSIVYEYRREKDKLYNLFIMYKAKFIFNPLEASQQVVEAPAK